jgi:hypothetical protein
MLSPLWVGLCLGVVPAIGAADLDPAVEEVRVCMDRNLPAKSSVQTVELTAVDRAGGEQVSRVKIYGKRFDDGFRRVKLRFTKPVYLRDSEFLVVETEGSPHAFLYTTELRRAKRVTARGSGGTLFGTDFSSEDLERWQGFNRPGETKREPDSVLGDRPVYVLSTNPADEANSAYERVAMFVDKETCAPLKTEFYERGGRLRRVLTADPETLIREAGIWVVTELVIRDVRDETLTRVVVEDFEIDEVADKVFSLGRMGRRGD